jgi:hypothetical protein
MRRREIDQTASLPEIRVQFSARRCALADDLASFIHRLGDVDRATQRAEVDQKAPIPEERVRVSARRIGAPQDLTALVDGEGATAEAP